MTEKQWNAAEGRLGIPCAMITLKVDGYRIDIQTQLDKMKLVLAVYVNGEIRLDWGSTDCEIRRKFYFGEKRTLLSRKQREDLKKEKKAIQKAVKEKMEYKVYTPYWNSFRSLKRHLIKNCTSIELWEELSM